MATQGTRKSSNATNVALPISVRTKVCRYKDGLFTDGVVIEIKTSKARKQKVTLKCYVIQFDGLEQLCCDEDTVRMMMACYASRSSNRRTTVAQLAVAKGLVPDGYQLYTMWTPDLSALSPGCKPPPFCTGKRVGKIGPVHQKQKQRLKRLRWIRCLRFTVACGSTVGQFYRTVLKYFIQQHASRMNKWRTLISVSVLFT